MTLQLLPKLVQWRPQALAMNSQRLTESRKCSWWVVCRQVKPPWDPSSSPTTWLEMPTESPTLLRSTSKEWDSWVTSSSLYGIAEVKMHSWSSTSSHRENTFSRMLRFSSSSSMWHPRTQLVIWLTTSRALMHWLNFPHRLRSSVSFTRWTWSWRINETQCSKTSVRRSSNRQPPTLRTKLSASRPASGTRLSTRHGLRLSAFFCLTSNNWSWVWSCSVKPLRLMRWCCSSAVPSWWFLITMRATR